jgi:probable HAF family extracellular repeat protein
VPGATFTQASGINDSGQIVGVYFDIAGNEHGFLLDRGTFTTINVPGSGETSAVDQ